MSGSATCPGRCSTSPCRPAVRRRGLHRRLMFDGSSIRGFQAIHESDMQLLPRPGHRAARPVPQAQDAEHQLLRARPADRRAVQPRPAQRGPQSRGRTWRLRVADTATSAPRPSSTSSTRAGSDQAHERLPPHRLGRGLVEHRPRGGRRQPRLQVRLQGRLLPGAAGTTTTPTCATRWSRNLIGGGIKVERGAPRGRHRQARPRSTTSSTRCSRGRRRDAVQVHRQEHGLARTARPRPSCPSRCSATTARACTATSRCGRTARRCSTTRSATPACRTRRATTSAACCKHAPSLLAFTNPTVNSYHRLVPGFEAPVNLVYSQRNRSACIRIPITGTNPKAKRIEFRVPDPSCNPYLAFSAMLMAGLDGIKNKIEPPAPVDKDLYELPPDEAAADPAGARLAGAVLDAPGGRPRLPARRRRVHRRPDRDLDRLQAVRRDRPASGCARTRTSSSSTTTSRYVRDGLLASEGAEFLVTRLRSAKALRRFLAALHRRFGFRQAGQCPVPGTVRCRALSGVGHCPV